MKEKRRSFCQKVRGRNVLYMSFTWSCLPSVSTLAVFEFYVYILLHYIVLEMIAF